MSLMAFFNCLLNSDGKDTKKRKQAEEEITNQLLKTK